ncbi:MAG: biotin-dependent carboxyltransferase family protein [Burkholderiaceae bacterium]
MIEVLATSALATVQDFGRDGALRWGVGSAGAMDPLALAAGNILLGNADDAAAIEVPVFPLRVRFVEGCAFAITGVDVDARLDERPVLPWTALRARAGQQLLLSLPRRDATWPASRAYLCLAGGVDVPVVLGSRSTQLRGTFGGLDGRPLCAGDVLRSGAATSKKFIEGLGLVPPALAMPLQRDGLPALRVLPAAEYAAYTEASRAAFWAEPWKITAQSDRYGYRLEGRPLEAFAPIEMRSHGIVPGVIQVPPGGQPIVQMRDAQPSGGYPKLGTVIEADLWRLGQAPVGSRVRFVECDWDAAVAALEETQRWLSEARRWVSLQRAAA